jgi:hypothetical protein
MDVTAALTEIEAVEFGVVDILSRLPQSDRRRGALQDALGKARSLRASLLARSPDTIRKGGVRRLSLSLPAHADTAVEFARAEGDRISEARRLVKRAGKTRFRAPEELRGQSLRLIDGQRLDVPEDGFCEVAAEPHPAGGEPAVHAQLRAMRFVPLPDEDELDVVKSALRSPVVAGRGDQDFIDWLRARAGR